MAANKTQRDVRIRTIESLLARYSLSNRWLAGKIGASHTNINNWLAPDGPTPRDRTVYDDMIAALREHGPREGDQILQRGGTRLIPVQGGLRAGKPGSDFSDERWEEVLDWGNDFERWARVIDGYSMADTLLPGDLAVFENRRAEPGNVVQAYNDGEELVKAMRVIEGHTWLYSFNEDYEPMDGTDWKVKGVCVGRIRYKAYGVREVVDFPHGLTFAMRKENF